jgi:3-keto-disaccharide hydrolase
MQRFVRLMFPFALGALLMALALHALAPAASAQSGEGWTTLLDDKTMGEWNKVGESNWRHEDGAVVADKKSGQDPGYLVSKAPYKDFQLHVEFWASDDANSGVFLRCQDPSKLGDRSCYEVNIFDQRKDPTYGTGGIVNFSEVNPMPKAGGKWNIFEITAKGRLITVVLNGQKTVELHNGMFVEGPLGLQHGAGVIKFRKVAIKPL